MLKIGIVGARGLANIMGFRSMDDVEVVALCDIDEELLLKQQAEHNIPKTYRVFEDMLESDIDAVVISTPMQLHVPQAIAALQAGKHVLSEVTAGVSMDELWWLIEAVEKSGKTYMMAENYCYFAENVIIREMVEQGILGDVYYGEGEYLHNIQNYLTYPNGQPSWRRYWQLGKRGAFYPTHSIGPIMQWFKGERIAQVACFGTGRHVDQTLRQEDTTLTMCQMESGKLARIRIDCISPRPHNMTYYSLQGTKGVVECSRFGGGVDEAKFSLNDTGNPDEMTWKSLSEMAHLLPAQFKNATDEQRAAGHGGSDFFIAQNFVDVVHGKMENPVDVYTACEWTAVGLLSEVSIRNGARMMDMPKFRKNTPIGEQQTIIL